MNLAAIIQAAEIAERRAGITPPMPPFIDGLHAKQRAFVLDRSRNKAALCSRRAGKSWGLAAWLLEGGYTAPGAMSLYIARSKGLARQIMWPAFADLDAKYGLNLWLREIDGQLMVEMPNGHRIWLAGAKDSSEIEKFRGPKYRRVAIDEAQAYGAWLRTLVHDILEPALIDYKGEMALTGTPSAVPAGLFYEVTTGDGGQKWPVHQWTIRDNPHIADVDEELVRIREKNGWKDESHPTYQREWLGVWVLDMGALVYPFCASRNGFVRMPESSTWRWVIGMDLGFVDSTAWVVGAIQPRFPEIWFVEAHAKSGLSPSTVAAYTERLLEKYPGAYIVADEGGLGKGYAEEMRQRHNLPVQAADKSRKRAYQEMLAGDLRAGLVQVHLYDCRALVDEYAVLQWNAERTAEDERFANHLSDAALYLHRELKPYYRPELEPPPEGSPEYSRMVDEQERAQVRKASERKNKRKNRDALRRRDWRKLVG